MHPARSWAEGCISAKKWELNKNTGWKTRLLVKIKKDTEAWSKITFSDEIRLKQQILISQNLSEGIQENGMAHMMKTVKFGVRVGDI